MDPMAAIRDTFFLECEEQLAELENGLMAMEAGEANSETVNAVFRAVHSIKGGGGAFALEELVRFAHVFETTLDGVRAGRLTVDAPAIRTMLMAADILADLVRAARDGTQSDGARIATTVAELTRLSGAAVISSAGVVDEDDMSDLFQPIAVSLDLAQDEAEAASNWIITFAPRPEMYANANEAALILRELASLGELSVELHADGLPDLAALDPEGAYFRWTLRLQSDCNEAKLREVFEWVESDCDLDISRPALVASDDATAAPTDDGFDLAALLASLAPTASGNPAPAEAVSLTVESGPAQTSGPSSKPAEVNATIRVDLVRVDRLIDLVGELVINEAMLNQRVLEAGVARASGMNSALDSLSQLTREIQDSVMAIRAQPVRSVFQRMPRLVREVAAMTGKSVRLVTEGEGTEVDKTVVERLSDPLTHMIRNAIDHGLETPAIRRDSGKPEEGVVRLSALHRSGRIVIEVADDGAGLDRARIKAKAAEKGLIAADAVLSDEETDNLIFMPGFSTAATISDISGRGVGLDVVRRSVQSLGGRISIASRPGKGSTFTLSLPLTLAVLDGMVVTVAGHTLVVPLGPILETLKPGRDQLHALGQDGRVISLRGGYIPVVDVGVSLGYRDRADPERGVALLVEGEGGERVVLQVDEIQGQRQIVIKSLEANYAAVRGIAAATVMGDGRVALILDVDAVIASSKGDSIGTPQDAARAEPFLLEMR